jgi:hypothetical protein
VSTLNLAVRFACELAAVVAVVWWGWPWLGIVLGAALVAFWGAFMGPRSARRLRDPLRLVVELAIFAGATAAYVAVGPRLVAIVFAVAALVTALLVRRWPEPVR